MRIYLVVFLVILSIYGTNAVIKFLKVENCTTTDKSLHIERYETNNGMLNVVLDIFKPVDQVFVSYFVEDGLSLFLKLYFYR